MKKYHPWGIIVALGVIGLAVLTFCVFFGSGIAHIIGKFLNDKCKLCPNYFSDFLGGALGFTVGFILDKLCIEKINQVFKYKALMKIVKNELIKIKEIEYLYEEKLEFNDDYLDICNTIVFSLSANIDRHNVMYVNKICKCIKDKDDKEIKNEIIKQHIESEIICKFNVEDLRNEIIEKNEFKKFEDKIKDEKNNRFKLTELIFDDIVKNAETISILANLPFASKYNDKLINSFGIIHKYIEEFNEANFEKRKEKWLYLQCYINLVKEVI